MPRWTESPTTRTALSSHQFKSVSPLSSPLVPRCLSPSLGRSLLLYPTRASPTKLLFETWQPSRSGRGFRFTHRRLRSSFFLDTREIHLSRLFETSPVLPAALFPGVHWQRNCRAWSQKGWAKIFPMPRELTFYTERRERGETSRLEGGRASSTPPEMRIDRLIGRSFHGKTWTETHGQGSRWPCLLAFAYPGHNLASLFPASNDDPSVRLLSLTTYDTLLIDMSSNRWKVKTIKAQVRREAAWSRASARYKGTVSLGSTRAVLLIIAGARRGEAHAATPCVRRLSREIHRVVRSRARARDPPSGIRMKEERDVTREK